MPTEEEIRADYTQQHNTLTTSYYAGTSGLTKVQFDAQHIQIWNDMVAALLAIRVYTDDELAEQTATARHLELHQLLKEGSHIVVSKPAPGQYRIISVERQTDGKMNAKYNDIPE